MKYQQDVMLINGCIVLSSAHRGTLGEGNIKAVFPIPPFMPGYSEYLCHGLGPQEQGLMGGLEVCHLVQAGTEQDGCRKGRWHFPPWRFARRDRAGDC